MNAPHINDKNLCSLGAKKRLSFSCLDYIFIKKGRQNSRVHGSSEKREKLGKGSQNCVTLHSREAGNIMEVAGGRGTLDNENKPYNFKMKRTLNLYYTYLDQAN